MTEAKSSSGTTATQAKSSAARAPAIGGGDGDAQSLADAALAKNLPSVLYLLAALVILVAGGYIGRTVWHHVRPSDFMPSSNYAVYAGLFIMALAIERVLEPFSGLFAPSTTKKKTQAVATAAKAARLSSTQPVGSAETIGAQNKAAAAKSVHHGSQANRAVLMWAFASGLAMVICAWVGVFILRSVEASNTSNPPNRWVDLVITGLVVGAGTKPLHDLITNIQSSSSSSSTSSSTS